MQFQICNSSEVWVSVNRAEAHRIARKRTGALAKMIRHARTAQKQETREYRRAEQELQNEIRESDRRNRALWKRIRVKPADRTLTGIERKPQAHKPTKTGWLANASQLPRYSGQVIDRMGRAGIFFRVRYYGHSTKAGVGRRSTLYIWEGAHETNDGRVMFASNVGETAEEAIAALEAVELFNREAQTGAKLLFHAIANVPYQLIEMDGGIERMFEIGRRFAEEQFGSRDLPFALALHPPSEEGDQRNWHLHPIFSTRPLVRTGDHEWDIGRMMQREIDNPEAFEEMRHLYARIQTEVVQEAGFNISYTALSNAERGLPNAPTKHLGPIRTARVRRGEQDQVNESNWETVLAGEAALLDEQLRHDQEQAMAEQALFDRVQERAAPLVADVTNGPSLAIAALAPHAEAIANLSHSADILGGDGAAHTPGLSIANMQPRNRRIASVTSLRDLPLSEQDGSPGTFMSRSAVRSTERDLPRVPTTVVADVVVPLSALSLPAARAGGHGIAAMPVRATQRANAFVPVLTLASVSAGKMGPAIAKPPTRVALRPTVDGIGLSLGGIDGPARRPIAVPKEVAAFGDNADRELDDLRRIFAARMAEVEGRHKLARRNRAAKERAEAERARKEAADQHEREEAERLRAEAEQALEQNERDAAEARNTVTASLAARTARRRMLIGAASQRESLMAGWNPVRPRPSSLVAEPAKERPLVEEGQRSISARPTWRSQTDPRDIGR